MVMKVTTRALNARAMKVMTSILLITKYSRTCVGAKCRVD